LNSLVPTVIIGLSLFAIWESMMIVWKTFSINIPVILRPILFVTGGVLASFATLEGNWLIILLVGLSAAGLAKLCNIFYQLVLAAGESRALDIISRATTRLRAERSTASGASSQTSPPS
jgi:hypothetical protein